MSKMKHRDGTQLMPISSSVSDVLEYPNIIVKLDTAPDGVNRYLEISRKEYELDMRADLANYLNTHKENLPERITEALNIVDDYVNKLIMNKNIVQLGKDNPGSFYLAERPVLEIMPDTLLSQVLGRTSKLDLLYNEHPLKSHSYKDAAKMNTSSLSVYGDEEFQKARKQVESKKYLAVSLQDNSVSLAEYSNRNDTSSLNSLQPWRNEHMALFSPGIIIKKFGQPILKDDFNGGYPSHLARVANDHALTLQLRISRQNIAEQLPSLFKNLKELHGKGLIHCDVKPQNILCLKEGITPFDPINVKTGEVSPGVTHNFCAPEQVLALPVSPATDIYNLGLILLMLIDGVLYGKISGYVIPLGNSGVKNINLLTEPEIYLDYENSNILNNDGIPHWQSFLKKCLAFDPKHRFINMDSFSEDYNQLITRFPLQNNIEFQPHFGRLSIVESNQEFEAGWFV